MRKIDLNLVHMRSAAARMSLKDIAKHFHKTPQRTKYTLSLLEKENILRNPHCLIDYSVFDILVFRVYIKGGYVRDQEKTKMIEQLSHNSSILSIIEFEGEYDFAVEVGIRHPSELRSHLSSLLRTIPSVTDYKVLLNLSTYLYSSNYLTKEPPLDTVPSIIIGGERNPEHINTRELQVIEQLITNPLARLSHLAKTTSLHEKTVKHIIDTLTEQKIIRGFRYVRDLEKLNITKRRLFLKLHNISQEREKSLLLFFEQTPEIVQADFTIGDWDIELDIESIEKSKIRYIIVKLRDEFKDIIERFNLIDWYTTYQRTYLPQWLFKNLTQPLPFVKTVEEMKK